ncbi:MAG TPA: hypothetical protein VJS12_18745 [Steroidobacteraceae bacterium]|nr:hypothetical protein [Steroidobacteraceae bacterium]
MSEERFRGEPRPRKRRLLTLAAATLVALAIAGFWIGSREPSYQAPPGEEIDILLELAGVFPDKYGIMWREHGVLHSTDPDAQLDPSLLRDAQFMHNLTTGGAPTEGDIHIEVAYRFYAHDHEIPARASTGMKLDKLTADAGQMSCVCQPPAIGTECTGSLGFGNYEFTLTANYNTEQCPNGISPQREKEFRSSMITADRLISFYLKPLRRKPSWL